MVPVLLSLLFVSMSTPAMAQGFDALLERLRLHPEIVAYVDKANAAGHAAEGETGLPDPMLFFEEKDLPIGSSTSQGEQQQMIGFSQDIPAFGTRGAKEDRMQAESGKNKILADYAFAAMKARLITTLADIKKVKALETIAREQQGLSGVSAASIKGRIAANQATPADAAMTDNDSVDAALKLTDLAEERRNLENMLTNMLGDGAAIDPPVITPVAWNGDAEKTYPLILAQSDIRMAQADQDLREAEYGPALALETGVTRMDNGDQAATARIGLTVPLWAASSQTPKLESAKASLSAAERMRDSVRRDTIQKLANLKTQIDISARRKELLKHKEVLLQKAVSAATRQYEAGKTDLAAILKIKREKLEARAAYVNEEARHIGYIAEFNHYFIQGE